jgi:hypothetical protein
MGVVTCQFGHVCTPGEIVELAGTLGLETEDVDCILKLSFIPCVNQRFPVRFRSSSSRALVGLWSLIKSSFCDVSFASRTDQDLV